MTRKAEVLALALAGLRDAEIADRLGISRRTVRAVLVRLRASGTAIPTSAERHHVAHDERHDGAPEGDDGTHDRGGDHDDAMSVPL